MKRDDEGRQYFLHQLKLCGANTNGFESKWNDGAVCDDGHGIGVERESRLPILRRRLPCLQDD